MALAATAVRGFAWFCIGYFVVLNSAYLVLLALAAGHAVRDRGRGRYAGLAEYRQPAGAPGQGAPGQRLPRVCGTAARPAAARVSSVTPAPPISASAMAALCATQ